MYMSSNNSNWSVKQFHLHSNLNLIADNRTKDNKNSISLNRYILSNRGYTTKTKDKAPKDLVMIIKKKEDQD